MGLANQNLALSADKSWTLSTEATDLSEIIRPDISVAVWQRAKQVVIESYFESVFEQLGMGVRRVFEIENLKESLSCILPEAKGQQSAIEDICLLAEMLTCLFDCSSVGLRLAPLTSAMCPRFHVDKIQVRLVNTYCGDGTEWIPREYLHDAPASNQAIDVSVASKKGFYLAEHIQQLSTFDVALLKGSAWPQHEHMAAVHRSCSILTGSKRILLTLDPV